MSAWLTYFKERFPLPVYLLLVGGMAGSGTKLTGGKAFGATFWASFFGLMVFFAVLRLMDEFKDYDKDRIAHPERPLPRGLLKKDQVNRAINGSVLAMVGIGLGFLYFSVSAAGLYLFVTGYLWLMYKEFYAGGWLGKRPLLYAVTHQVILLPLCALPVAMVGGPWAREGLLYGTLVLGSFFSYEVCRKLDPKAHPLLGYYGTLYGSRGCLAIVGVCAIISAWAACQIWVGMLTIPASALLLVSFLALSVPRGHKAVEGVASFSLLVHIWSILLMGWL